MKLLKSWPAEGQRRHIKKASQTQKPESTLPMFGLRLYLKGGARAREAKSARRWFDYWRF